MKMVSPESLSASKACVGCGSSAITQVRHIDDVADGFSPSALSRYCSQAGDGCTLTLSNSSAL
jgi:hypothetical protein